MPRVHVVVNPISGSPRRAARIAGFTAHLEDEGAEVTIRPTRCAGDGARLAAEAAAGGIDIVVAAGGDGTVNEVARGLFDGPRTTSLGILPLGTSNLVARHLGIPLRAGDAAARGLLAGRRIAADAATANERLWLACVGVGLDARIVEELARRRRGHIGYLSYVAPTLATLRRAPWPELRVVPADGPEVSGHLVLVLNARPYAAFLTPAPAARMTDGLLDVLVLRGRGVLRFARWGWRAWRGSLERDPTVTLLRSTRLRVEAESPTPYQVDGDTGDVAPVEIAIRAGALPIALPTAAHGDAPLR